MTYTLLIVTDGRRDCLERTLDSAWEMLPPPEHVVVVNDGDTDYANWVRAEIVPMLGEWSTGTVVHELPFPEKRGFGGAIRAGWALIGTGPGFVFHLEDDFVFERPVGIDRMAALLTARPELVQVALRRQPWNPEEHAAGGIVEQHPHDYGDETTEAGEPFLTHRRFFTTNPSLYRRSLIAHGWPETDHSEGVFTHRLLADPEARFAFWGARTDSPWVTHIGTERVGTGY